MHTSLLRPGLIARVSFLIFSCNHPPPLAPECCSGTSWARHLLLPCKVLRGPAYTFYPSIHPRRRLLHLPPNTPPLTRRRKRASSQAGLEKEGTDGSATGPVHWLSWYLLGVFSESTLEGAGSATHGAEWGLLVDLGLAAAGSAILSTLPVENRLARWRGLRFATVLLLGAAATVYAIEQGREWRFLCAHPSTVDRRGIECYVPRCGVVLASFFWLLCLLQALNSSDVQDGQLNNRRRGLLAGGSSGDCDGTPRVKGA